MKIITAAAALESGFDPNQKIRVDDPYQADKSWGDYFVRSSSGAHGDFDMALAFQRSENIYFAKVGLTIGAQKLSDMAKKFGIGRAPALDLAAAKGQLSNNGSLDRPTLLADTSYGQGELLTSPLQMAMVAATVGNHGVQVQPHYATEIRDGSGGILRTIGGGAGDQVISAATAAKLTTYLVGAVEAPGAFAFGAKIAGCPRGGKDRHRGDPRAARRMAGSSGSRRPRIHRSRSPSSSRTPARAGSTPRRSAARSCAPRSANKEPLTRRTGTD